MNSSDKVNLSARVQPKTADKKRMATNYYSVPISMAISYTDTYNNLESHFYYSLLMNYLSMVLKTKFVCEQYKNNNNIVLGFLSKQNDITCQEINVKNEVVININKSSSTTGYVFFGTSIKMSFNLRYFTSCHAVITITSIQVLV